MKKTFFYLLLAVLPMGLFSSCENMSTTSLVGHVWKHTETKVTKRKNGKVTNTENKKGSGAVLEFYNNGTFKSAQSGYTIEGTYSLSDGDITLNISGDRQTYEIKRISFTSFELISLESSTYTPSGSGVRPTEFYSTETHMVYTRN